MITQCSRTGRGYTRNNCLCPISAEPGVPQGSTDTLPTARMLLGGIGVWDKGPPR